MKIKVYYVEVAPELESREFDLGSMFKLKNECTIGRSPESDLVLDSPDLSRSHGRIISKNGNYYFIDLGSRNGSLFNDRLTTPAQEYLLNRDDTIRIGDFVLKIEEEEEQAATVFKVIDPALFKSKQPPVEAIPTPEAVVLPILPVVELAHNTALTPPLIHELDDEVPVVPIVEPHPPTALVANEFDDRSTFVQLGENHPPALIVDELNDEDPVVPVVKPHPPTALVINKLDDGDELSVVPIVEPHPPTALVINKLDDDDEVPVIPVVESHSPTALVVDELDDEVPVVEPHAPTALVVDELDDELPVVEEHPATALIADELEEVDIKFEQSSSVPIAIAASVPIVAIAAIDTVELNTPNKRFGAELLKQKQIVLIAHDEKIADLVELIDRNKDFLATCLTISWASISESLQQETGMIVSKEIAHGAAGGYQALAGLVNSGDILAVIFLRDLFAQNQAGKANEEAMLRLCNINEILLGTNIATADAIVHYLQS